MTNPIRNLLGRASSPRRLARLSRRRRSRSGSVLILVVALLVLMALIGTAWISTTGTDRGATAQHAFNTEIDLLVDGVVAMVKAAIGDDLFGPPAAAGQPAQYRPAQ